MAQRRITLKAAASDQVPIRSYAESNRHLLESYCRYLIARGQAAPTIRSYRDTLTRLVESLGSETIVDIRRSTIRKLLGDLYEKGLMDNSIRLHTAAIRGFFKYLRLTGLTKQNPTLLISYRRIPGRLPIVLTLQQVEALIGAARDPFERAVSEVLYSTGVRVSELVKLELENVDLPGRKILVKKGKGGKDRYVLFGSHAEKAMRGYLAWRPHETGYLFEAPARRGAILRIRKGSWKSPSWYGSYYSHGSQKQIRIGYVCHLPKLEDARREFDRILANMRGFKVLPARPYRPEAIRGELNRLAHRAGIAHVHPHALRRALACHMLSNGADLRVIQELLGHTNLTTTMRYTHLTAEDLKKTHERCHPFEQRHGGSNVEEK
jgi:integrase/recombinase XerC